MNAIDGICFAQLGRPEFYSMGKTNTLKEIGARMAACQGGDRANLQTGRVSDVGTHAC